MAARRRSNKARGIRFGVGGWGRCPCCKKDKDLTEHHDKVVLHKFLICEDCHRSLEEYIKLVQTFKESGSGQQTPE